ncbi:DNA (cytosine-5-)-methyltransferase [Psychromonas sp. MB-3u-54]|jgi:DNA (cytosine-5)-methyltransferase 1|uniref:DNA cytosine methyltransferase n=1 Tax=Psychromonas sp. MB-3u-54 TaxID=2058319 RepID=UPI000C34DF5A|nr:DNA cytosine methyltransferase [Psychromonas sp. MB-3u-54]PKH04328.1 DNA (cytosine-5-)-methyltransferase [Psychromonas sp. MB-3u-54]
MTTKAIDLFAGAGGFTIAAHDAGVNVIAAIEFDKAASNTYKENFIVKEKRSIKLINDDINFVEPLKLRRSLKLKIGELDLILGGPPCQGFSTHRINNSGVDDPRNILLLRYFEFVHEFRPKAFLVENVTGLLWKRHENHLNKFIELATKEDYEICYCDILNAKDYGVSQNRKRVFIYGVRKDVLDNSVQFPPIPTHFSPSSGKHPYWQPASTVFEPIPEEYIDRYIDEYFLKKTKYTKEESKDLLYSLKSGEPIPKDDKCNVYMQPSSIMIERFADTPLNGSREDAGDKHKLKCHSNGYNGHNDVYGRILIHQPSNTITTGCNNPSKGRFTHPWNNHGITLRHAARLQSFPDNFTFLGNKTEQAKQIGNAVPPRLGKKLIQAILNIK